MRIQFKKNESRILRLLPLLMLSLASAVSCHAAVYVPGTVNCANYTGNAKAECELKDNFTFDVTTNWTAAQEYYGTANITTDNPITKKHWFVSGVGNDHILYTNLRCDGSVVNDAVDNYYERNPCGTNASNADDYIKSDDLDNDLNVSPPGQEFTVVASSYDVGRTMSSVRIEWETNSVASPPATWGHGQTCSGGSCKICRQGTLCSGGYAVIAPEDLSTRPDGTMNRLWFRVILVDSSSLQLVIGGDTATTDPYRTIWTSTKGIPFYQDKYYQFQICNVSGCSGYCAAAPVINSASVDTSKCATGQPYTFNWTLNKAGQTEFLLNVYDATTHATVYSVDQVISPASASASYSFSPPTLYVGSGGLLQANHSYTWDLRVKDNAAPVSGQDCKQWSAWYPVSPATLSFMTCTPPSCTVSTATATPSTADFGTDISFSGNITGTGITGYAWKDGANVLGSGSLAGTGGTATGTYAFAGTTATTKTITLVGTLSNGGTCQKTVSVNLTVPAPCSSTFKIMDSAGDVPTEYYYGDDLTFQFLSSSYAGTIAHYHWYVDGSSYVNGSGVEYDFASVHDMFFNPPDKDYTIGLVVEHSDGRLCGATDKVIHLEDLPPTSCTAGINVLTDPQYFGQAVTLDADTSLSGSVTYQWYEGEAGSETLFYTGFDDPDASHVFSTTDGETPRIYLVTSDGGSTSCFAEIRLSLSESPGECITSPEPADEYVYGTDIPPTTIQTHRLVWEPGKVTYDSFEGEGTAGISYFHTVITENVSVSSLVPGNQEWVVINLYPTSDGLPVVDDKDVPPTDVILRDFSFVPDPSALSNPSASREADGFSGETVSWKGYDWLLRDGGTGDPGFGGWSDANVVGPDANGYLTLRLDNPSGTAPEGAQIENGTAGLGYGTYTVVAEGNFAGFDKNVVFEGLTLHFPDPYYPSATDPCAEFNAGETASWDDPASSTVLLLHHNSWYGCGPTGTCPQSLPATCSVDFTPSCGIADDCIFGQQIDFTAFALSGTPVSYRWALDASSNYFDLDGDSFAAKTFSIADGSSHSVYLSAVDGDGNACTGQKEVLMVRLGVPVWNEVMPLLQTPAVLFFVFLFLVRIILLRI